MNLVRKDDDILDTYVVVEKPKGLGFCIGSDDDLDAYEGLFFEKEDRENLIPIFVFNNELPYSIGDTQVCFYNKDSKETIFTNDTNVVVFSDFPFLRFLWFDSRFGFSGWIIYYPCCFVC